MDRYISLSFQPLTGLSTAKGLPNIPIDANMALIAIDDAPIRWRDDGTDPTAAIGTMELPTGKLRYEGALSRLRLIETTPSATCQITYWKITG